MIAPIILLIAGVLAVQPIHMRDMEVLSFYSDGYTGTMRGQPIPQMTLLTSHVPRDVIPDEIVCTNMGWDGLNVHWDCKAELKESWNLVRPSISCEGWSGPGDEYVVPGSCAISYEMEYRPVQSKTTFEEPKQEKQRKVQSSSFREDNKRFRKPEYTKRHSEHVASTWEKVNTGLLIGELIEEGIEWLLGFSVIGLLVVGILIFLCVKCCCSDHKSGTKEGECDNKDQDKENATKKEDVVEKHAHAISYSR